MPLAGVLLCLASAAAFGAMGIFGKLAYAQGADVTTLLAARFLLASAALWLVLAATGRLRAVRAVSRRDLAIALALGAIGYSAQAATFFAALDRIDASLLSMLLYTFPSIVTVLAIVLRREAPSWRTAAALGLATAGLVLVLTGASSGALDTAGTLLGLSAAVVYSVYILSSGGVADRLDPLVLTTLVCTGAAVTLTVGGLAVGGLHPADVSAEGFGWLAAIALVSTVAAIAFFFAGLPLVGPTAASILSTTEPVVTVTLAYLVFSESMGPTQLVGGLLVLSAVVAMQTRRRGSVAASPLPEQLVEEPA